MSAWLLLASYAAVFSGVLCYQLGRYHEAKAIDRAQRNIFKGQKGGGL